MKKSSRYLLSLFVGGILALFLIMSTYGTIICIPITSILTVIMYARYTTYRKCKINENTNHLANFGPGKVDQNGRYTKSHEND